MVRLPIAQWKTSKAGKQSILQMHHIPVRESSCFSHGAKSTGAVLGASLLLLRCNLKSTYDGNPARFYVLELRDVARPRVSLESLNPPGEKTEIAISRLTMYIISAGSLSALQLGSVSIRAVVHLSLRSFPIFNSVLFFFFYIKHVQHVSHSLEHGLSIM